MGGKVVEAMIENIQHTHITDSHTEKEDEFREMVWLYHYIMLIFLLVVTSCFHRPGISLSLKAPLCIYPSLAINSKQLIPFSCVFSI